MKTRFVNIDRNTPLLLPPDLRDWVPSNHLAHFVVDLVETLAPGHFKVNCKGTGSAQYPPTMMCALLIYSYVTGRFSSRAIERATHDDVAVRFVTGDTHPDHDTICTFRRVNGAAFSKLFVSVLESAQQMNVLKRFGTVSIDGTKVLASASKHKAVSYGRAGEMIDRLKQEVMELITIAETADSTPLDDGLTIPDEIARREDRIAKLKTARIEIEKRARQKAEAELAAKLERREKRKSNGERLGRAPTLGKIEPEEKSQYNFTDPESRIMKAGNGHHFEQSYNAQAAVETESRLIVSQSVTDEGNDKKQLIPVAEGVVPIFTPRKILVDSGYNSEEAIREIELDEDGKSTGTIVLAPSGRKHHHHSVDDLKKRLHQTTQSNTAGEAMTERMQRHENREAYKQRKQTVEPVFGIIKEAMGFRRFSMRGKRKVADEWAIVTCAYNIKRLFHIGVSFAQNGSGRPRFATT